MLMGKLIRPKFSKELLNLRKIQETMARSKDYTEAHKLKLKADALEAWELGNLLANIICRSLLFLIIEKWHGRRQQDLLSKEAKFKQVKLQELSALQKRIHTGREEQKQQRHLDLERLLQRYQNVKVHDDILCSITIMDFNKAELEQQQNLERIRLEKLVQSGSLTTLRRPRTQRLKPTGSKSPEN